MSTSVGPFKHVCALGTAALAVAALAITLLGCASEPPGGIEGNDAPNGSEWAVLREALTPGFQPIAPCLHESDYVSRAVVRFFDGVYSPRCLRLASGGTVVFQGNLAVHPLQPRAGGTEPSLILPTSFGGQVEFEFPDHGLFPYQDGAHPEQIGVIWSTYY